MLTTDKLDTLRSVGSQNILEVISDFVPMKKIGSQYRGVSPFANERTPSFFVKPSKGIFKCFSSGKGGDCIEFLMLSQNWRFIDAAKYLGKKYGIDIDGINEFYYTHIPVQYTKPKQPIPDYIPIEVLTGFSEENNLFKFIAGKVGLEKTNYAFNRYKISTYKNWCIFWQVDVAGKVRSGKYIKYLEDGHRDKNSNTTWEHSKIRNNESVYPDFSLMQCFFGEHLINIGNKPIAIVESEKTALICSIFIDKYIWVACGSKYGLNEDKCRVLANRSVTLFPDLNAIEDWKIKAKEFNFSINTTIQKQAKEGDLQRGLDLADYLL